MKNLFLAAFISFYFFSNAQYIQETYNMSDSLVERKVAREGKLSFEFNNKIHWKLAILFTLFLVIKRLYKESYPLWIRWVTH